MPDYNALNPTLGCHPILPANTPIDDVRFSTVVPVMIPEHGNVPARIPPLTVMPMYFANVHAASSAHQSALAETGASGAELSTSWKAPKLQTQTRPGFVTVSDFEELVAKRAVSLDGWTVPVELTASAVAALSAGRSARVRVKSDAFGGLAEIELKPNFPLPAAQYFVSLDPGGQSDFLATGEIEVAGVGRKAVKLERSQIEQFVRTGQATLPFTEDDKATLTFIRHERSILDALTPNVADRLGLQPQFRALTAASASVAATLIQPSLPPSPGGYAPPPPPVGMATPALPPPPAQAPPVRIPEFSLVLFIPYLQRWALNGYARGAMLNSLSLAPQEETTIEVFSWQRRRREAEQSTGSETETMLEGGVNNKDTLEVVDEAKRDNGWKLEAGVGFNVPAVPINGNVSFNIKDELVRTSKATAQQINEATMKASTKFKATRQTKVVETSEFGTETKVVRRLRNPNLGRTLNLDCFEVVAHYGVDTRVEIPGMRLAVLAEMHDFLSPMLLPGLGQKEAVLAFEHVLERFLPDKLRAGFAAARLLLAAERYCKFRCAAGCDCSKKSNVPSTGSEQPAQPQTREDELKRQLAEVIRRVKTTIDTIALAGVANLGLTIKQHWDFLTEPSRQPTSDQWEQGRTEVKRYLFRRFIMLGPATRFWSEARSFAASTGESEAAARRLLTARQAQGADVMNAITSFLTMQFKVVGELANIIGSGWPLVAPDMIANGLGFDDAGLESGLNELQAIMDDLTKLRAPTPGQADGAGKSTADAPQTVQEVRDAPDAQAYDPKELAAASIDFDILVRNLANNANFFRAQLWRSVDPADRLRFLSIYGKLATLTTGRILTFVGTSAVLEIDIGKDPELTAWFERTISKNEELKSFVDRFDTILPTPGVTLEARLGACDALEPYLADSRNIELSRLTSVAGQEKLELERMAARINAGELADPKSRSPLVVVDKTP